MPASFVAEHLEDDDQQYHAGLSSIDPAKRLSNHHILRATIASVNNGDAEILDGHPNIGFGWNNQQSTASLQSGQDGCSSSAQPRESKAYPTNIGTALRSRLHPIIESYFDPVSLNAAHDMNGFTAEALYSLDYPALDATFENLPNFERWPISPSAREVGQYLLGDGAQSAQIYDHGPTESFITGSRNGSIFHHENRAAASFVVGSDKDRCQ